MTDIAYTDICVVGAGVVGLAVARELALRGHKVVVLEKSERFGEGISSRNSEVIHAGIYYPDNSLKARLCVRGKNQLYEYCESRHVPHRRLGKLIVATSDEENNQLAAILEKARRSEVVDLEYIEGAKLKALEPAVNSRLALLSPSTGIIDVHGLMTSFLADLEANDGSLACRAEVKNVRRNVDGFIVEVAVDGGSYSIGCRGLVNSAGLGAQSVAASVEGLNPAIIPPLYFCKGSYFLLQAKNPFNHLIYPVPDPSGAGLGVHATIDTGGQVRFGPDVEYIGAENYRVSDERLAMSYDAIRRYYPGLEDGWLIPGYAGIRPKLQAPGDEPADFVIQTADDHEIPGLINLFGIESPGLTSSMAIAETVAASLGRF
ncbi:MAG: NAD(P)/FAD-dependent oxidoreductase [Gammaproteobacteria bacterium]|jgi:L-2-hydroxyglutarate oxidase LhgO|nr:NAD(P)/FAD-dependent oxidoreductase [Gammaproteobacteria bacterium]MBT7369155.1 NAD(P)/FAD-dependent oxidoreductase [Gammaproteobacteria bacterium]